MKRLAVVVAIGTYLAFGDVGAHAAVIINPSTGLNGNFLFSALGPVDSINGTSGSTMTVMLATPGTIDVNLEDTGQVGDVFALTLNGATVTPTSTIGPGGFTGPFFEAFYDDMPLAAGLNTLGILLTASCCDGGEGLFDASSVSPTAAVPEPAAITILGAGFLSLALLRRRKAPRASS